MCLLMGTKFIFNVGVINMDIEKRVPLQKIMILKQKFSSTTRASASVA